MQVGAVVDICVNILVNGQSNKPTDGCWTGNIRQAKVKWAVLCRAVPGVSGEGQWNRGSQNTCSGTTPDWAPFGRIHLAACVRSRPCTNPCKAVMHLGLSTVALHPLLGLTYFGYVPCPCVG
jgi:hypothetical protein